LADFSRPKWPPRYSTTSNGQSKCKTLTVLSSESIGQDGGYDDDGDEDDEELKERWTPRFRR
jgi:hypothetical protein